MESKYNPFVNRYPNRRKIISNKDRESEILIEKQKNLKLSKNLSSLNENNKKLNLFVKHQKEEEINFPTKFSNYGQIPEIIQNNLSKLKLETLTPIQNLAFGYLFNYGNKFFYENKNQNENNYDLVGCAQTGSGKTLGYLIPAVSFLFNDPQGIPEITKGRNNYGYVSYPLILIILPTRELAIQTYEESLKLLYKSFINTVVVYGGEKSYNQINQLNEGCDILIGTPGRLIDFLQKGFIKLSDVKYVVIDEADKLLDMGFEEDIDYILFSFDLPKNYNRFLMSATFPKKVLSMVDKVMRQDYCYITHGNYLGEKKKQMKMLYKDFI